MDLHNTEGITYINKKSEMLNKVLTPREKEIIALRFGFPSGDSMTLEQVGNNLNLTRERVRQIESKALNKMRTHPRLKFLKDYLN
jgi:RNA polymerase sigma factor (sigma-70 family)